MTEYLHEIIQRRAFAQELRTAVANYVDPWENDRPIPYALTTRYNLIDDIVHPTNSDLGAS
jgi:hypothetical protein